jgi:hypothetical protein
VLGGFAVMVVQDFGEVSGVEALATAFAGLGEGVVFRLKQSAVGNEFGVHGRLP